jgi:hypothetical protein
MDGDVDVDYDDVIELVEAILDTQLGDFNLDGVVDDLDAAIVTAGLTDACNESMTCGWAQGDCDCSGTVNSADLACAGIAEANLTAAYSVGIHAASGGYAGGTVEFAIGIDGTGLVEPREQAVGEMSIRLVFDADVDAGGYAVSVAPDTGAMGSLSAGAVANELILSFDAVFPTGRYEITLTSGTRAVITFPMCYSQGDSNCSGDTTGLDLALIQSPSSWNRDLSEPLVDPRGDVNRDGQVTGLDLAKAQSPAFWNLPIPSLTCSCP